MRMLDRFDWKKEYTLVVLLNIIYILFFSYLMTSFT